MKVFKIHHPKNGIINHECCINIPLTHVHTVITYDIESAYTLSQNFNEEYAKLKIRSTCVGDIIQDCSTNKCYIILGLGVRLLSTTDITNS